MENLGELFAEAVRESLNEMLRILRDPQVPNEDKINAADAVLNSELAGTLESWR